MKPKYAIPNQLECGNVRFHARRITCLEFHPTNDNVILSGDKVHMSLVLYMYTIKLFMCTQCYWAFDYLLLFSFLLERSTWDMGLCEAT